MHGRTRMAYCYYYGHYDMSYAPVYSIGHYPIYSVGVNCDSNVLLALLQPLLEKHQVHMYVAGHDHNTQVRVC